MADLHLTPHDFAQQLKDRLPIDQVIVEYVPSLARRGASFKGLCPFHNEKTPSFHVHPDRGFYHCFGCGAHGDLIKFVMEAEKIDFMMALEHLARRAGIELPAFRPGEQGPDRDRLTDLRAACTWAEEFFIQQLRAHPRGELARKYLQGRGLSDEEIAHYRLGYSPDGYEVLLRAGQSRGFSAELLAEAGLVSRREQGGFVDRFRDRVMFPITDAHGQVVAFGGRIIEKIENTAKYINSAETPIYKKGQLLYGIPLSREAIKQAGEVLLLEGYMDWLMLHRAGVRNVLAGLGTALTPEQARLLRRMTGRVALLYDGDEAGQKAMLRSSEMLLQQGIEVRAAVLPAEHDPDTFVRAEGTQALRDLVAAAPTALDYFIQRFAELHDVKQPEGKATAAGKLAPLLLAIEEPALREGYLARAAQRYGLRLETLEQLLRRRIGRTAASRAVRPPAGSTGGPDARDYPPPAEGYEGEDEAPAAPFRSPTLKSEQYLLFILLHLDLPWEQWQAIESHLFQDAQLEALYEKVYGVIRDWREGADPPGDLFAICDNEPQRDALSRILLLPQSQFDGAWQVPEREELTRAFAFQLLKLRQARARRQREELMTDLEIVRTEQPLGSGQLEQIEQLGRRLFEERSRFLEES